MSIESIRLEILRESYWQHIKAEKDIAFVFPDPTHIKRKKLTSTINQIIVDINKIKKQSS